MSRHCDWDLEERKLKRTAEGDELEPSIQRRRFEDPMPVVILGFTPINKPAFDVAKLSVLPSSVTEPDMSCLSPKTPGSKRMGVGLQQLDDNFNLSQHGSWAQRTSGMPSRIPHRQRAKVLHQLSTPPSTMKKPAIKAIMSRKSKVKDRYQQLAATQCMGPEISTTDAAGSLTCGVQARSMEPVMMSEINGELRLSELTMSKLSAFRYQAKPSESGSFDVLQNDPASHPQDLKHLRSQAITDATAPIRPIDDASPSFQSFCGASNSVEDPGEHLQAQEAQNVGFEETSSYTDANVERGAPDRNQSTDGSIKKQRFGLNPWFGGIQGCSHIADNDPNLAESATNEPLLPHALACRSARAFGAADTDNDLNLTNIEGHLTDNDDEDLLALYTHHHNPEEIAGDCQAEAANPFHTPASSDDQDHAADITCPWEPQVEAEQESNDSCDEFAMDPDGINDLLHLPTAQRTLELSSTLQLPSSPEIHAEDVKSPHHMNSSRPSSRQSVYSTLKNGVYVPVDANTTMDALTSDIGASRSSLRSQAPPADDLDTVLSNADDEEWFHLDEEDEIELANLTATISSNYEEIERNTGTKSSGLPKPCLVRPHAVNPTSPILISSSPPQQPPNLDPERALDPFVRSPFPKPVRDRSPILGLSASGVLRTCFRIGEALNAASIAYRTGTDVIIELYARVDSSSREQEGWKQRFQFADLFHSERPPFLNGTYELWKDAHLWEVDSRKFLGEEGKGRMCRAVGRLKREEPSKVWKMGILNIWEATWDDVGWVKGIVCAR